SSGLIYFYANEPLAYDIDISYTYDLPGGALRAGFTIVLVDDETHEVYLGGSYHADTWTAGPVTGTLGVQDSGVLPANRLYWLQYSLEKKPEGRPPKELGHSDQVTTSESLAEEHNVGEKTIRRDAEYATAVDELAENVGPEIKQQILSGDARLTKKDVVAIAELPKAEQKKVIKDHLGGNKKAVKEATTEAAPETSYPVSAKFSHSLNFISGFCTGLRNDHKTVAKVLKHKQWDKSRTAELARMLDAVTRSLTSLNTEMQSHVNGAET
ncbi:hypothetical protein LCGC14_2627300, partial [marine sediment metagenome]